VAGGPVSSSIQVPAVPEAVEGAHEQLEEFWQAAPEVPELDRIAFETAVIEAVSNAVQHAVAAPGSAVELGVDLSAEPFRLEARISEFGAAEPDLDAQVEAASGNDAESGRGLALIRALVTTLTFERHEDTNVWTLRRDSGQ
jgi:serine/threonine-protein kinase RsbW